MMRFIGALAGYTIQNILLYAEMNRKQQESETLQKMVKSPEFNKKRQFFWDSVNL